MRETGNPTCWGAGAWGCDFAKCGGRSVHKLYHTLTHALDCSLNVRSWDVSPRARPSTHAFICSLIVRAQLGCLPSRSALVRRDHLGAGDGAKGPQP